MCCRLLTLSVRCSPVVAVEEAPLGILDVLLVVVAFPVPTVPVTATV
jgi:hypothetical protein